jgi:hypothetical protein
LVPYACFVGLGFTFFASSCSEDPPIVLPSDGGSGGEGGAGGHGPVEGVISSSGASSIESDPRITVKGPNVVVVWSGRQLNGASHIGYVVSTNAGSTFTEPQQIKPPDGISFISPDVVIDAGDDIHIGFVGYSRAGAGADIYLASFALGSTAGEPENVTDPDDMMIGFYARPRLGFSNGGKLLIAHSETIDQTAELALLSKLPTEDIWERQVISNNQNHAFAQICTAALTMDGNTYITAVQGGRLLLYRSADDGMTWNATQAQDVNEGNSVRGPVTCVADEDKVWITYGIAGSDGLSRIRTVMSEDGGQNMSLWGTVSDPEIKPKFALNEMALQRPETVHIVYYNGAGAGDKTGSFLRVRATPANLMQDPPMMPGDPEPGLTGIEIASPIVFENDESQRQWLGTSIGLRYQDGKLYMAYVDNASGDAHIAFKVVDPG